METRNHFANAGATPPARPVSPSVGYPQGGVPGVNQATTFGPYWFHQISEELRAIVIAAGITPIDTDLNQTLDALNTMFTVQGHTHTLAALGAAPAVHNHTKASLGIYHGRVDVSAATVAGSSAFTVAQNGDIGQFELTHNLNTLNYTFHCTANYYGGGFVVGANISAQSLNSIFVHITRNGQAYAGDFQFTLTLD